MTQIVVEDPTTGAKKADGEKNRLDLLPVQPLEDIGKVLTYGAGKYDPHNWRKGMQWSRIYGATLRHLFAWWRGVDIDPETGISHLAHAACNLLFLIEYTYKNKDMDDRYVNKKTLPSGS